MRVRSLLARCSRARHRPEARRGIPCLARASRRIDTTSTTRASNLYGKGNGKGEPACEPAVSPIRPLRAAPRLINGGFFSSIINITAAPGACLRHLEHFECRSSYRMVSSFSARGPRGVFRSPIKSTCHYTRGRLAAGALGAGGPGTSHHSTITRVHAALAPHGRSVVVCAVVALPRPRQQVSRSAQAKDAFDRSGTALPSSLARGRPPCSLLATVMHKRLCRAYAQRRIRVTRGWCRTPTLVRCRAPLRLRSIRVCSSCDRACAASAACACSSSCAASS